MKLISTLFLILSLSSPSIAQPTAPIVFNQVLFSEGSDSWTVRDLNLYKKILKTSFGVESLTKYSASEVEDFLLSRILKREALLFEIDPLTPENPQRFEYLDYSQKEIEAERKTVAYALALLEFKKSQVSHKDRFVAWMDVLKKKYSVKMKNHV